MPKIRKKAWARYNFFLAQHFEIDFSSFFTSKFFLFSQSLRLKHKKVLLLLWSTFYCDISRQCDYFASINIRIWAFLEFWGHLRTRCGRCRVLWRNGRHQQNQEQNLSPTSSVAWGLRADPGPGVERTSRWKSRHYCSSWALMVITGVERTRRRKSRHCSSWALMVITGVTDIMT